MIIAASGHFADNASVDYDWGCRESIVAYHMRYRASVMPVIVSMYRLDTILHWLFQRPAPIGSSRRMSRRRGGR